MKKMLLTIAGVVAILFLLGVGYCYSRLNYTYSNADAVAYAQEHAHSRSRSLCAMYVRQSIEAGGCPTFGFPSSACDYIDFLPKLGFEELHDGEKRKAGDIVVFEGMDGHPHGHIAIWDGTHWISDFHQKNIIVNSAYYSVKPRYFRQSDGKHRRSMW